jgi:glucosamine 6-phosphate synthetase-like amidotransferase/phosphosugar isomerase protein
MGFWIGKKKEADAQRDDDNAHADFGLRRPVAVGNGVIVNGADLKQKLRPHGDKQAKSYHNNADDSVFLHISS